MTGSKQCLLDTSIIIGALKSDAVLGKNLDALDNIFVPLIVVGELLYGAYRSSHLSKHVAQVNLFLEQCIILLPDRQTAELYGHTKSNLMKKGKPLPENDIWIAAMALQYNLPLYENDKHFREIDGLNFFVPLYFA